MAHPLHLDRYERHLRRADRADTTIDTYRWDVERFADWYEKTRGEPPRPEEVTALEIRAFKRWLADDRRLAPTTINRALAALRSYFRWASGTGELAASNPADEIRDTRRQQLAPRSLSEQTVAALRVAAQERIRMGDEKGRGAGISASGREARRDRAILHLFLGTGLRLGELCGLDLEDVEVGPRSGRVTVRSGKNDTWRRVPLNSSVREALEAWLEVRRDVDTPALFVGRRGGRLQDYGVQRAITQIAEVAGLESDQVSPHILRHYLPYLTMSTIPSGT